MKTCNTCRFWVKRSHKWLIPGAQGRCVKIVHGNDCNACGATEKTPAFVVDGSGYAAALMTLPTFGCVLHEEKEWT